MTRITTLSRGLAPLCVLAALTATAFGQVKLEHKRHPGSSHKVQKISKVDQTLTIAGMDTVTAAETIAMVTISEGPRDDQGKVKATEKVDSLQITITAAGTEYSFDSANPDKAGSSPLEVMRDVHKAVANGKTTIVFGKDNRVESVEADQTALDSLPEQAKAMAAGQFDPENLKQAANQQLDVLPGEAVKKGDTWERTSTANFGAGQTMTFKTKYTYEGPVEKGGKPLHKITSKTLSVDFALADDSPLPLTVKGSELKAEDSAGTLLFDRELGHIVEAKESLHITGSITFEANGTPLPSTLDLTISSETTLQQ